MEDVFISTLPSVEAAVGRGAMLLSGEIIYTKIILSTCLEGTLVSHVQLLWYVREGVQHGYF